MCPEQLFHYWTGGLLPNLNSPSPCIHWFFWGFLFQMTAKLHSSHSGKPLDFVWEQWTPGCKGERALPALGLALECCGILEKVVHVTFQGQTMCIVFGLKKCRLLLSNLILILIIYFSYYCFNVGTVIGYVPKFSAELDGYNQTDVRRNGFLIWFCKCLCDLGHGVSLSLSLLVCRIGVIRNLQAILWCMNKDLWLQHFAKGLL